MRSLTEILESNNDSLQKVMDAQDVHEARMKAIGEKFLDSFEGIFSSDESFYSYEHMEDYVEAAKYFRDRYGRKNNSIRQVETKMNELLF